jgi:hypothetical protein
MRIGQPTATDRIAGTAVAPGEDAGYRNQGENRPPVQRGPDVH